MGDVSAEPSMEDILSSIKRIIAEEDSPKARRAPPPTSIRAVADAPSAAAPDDDTILELSDPIGERGDTPAEPSPPPAGIVSDQTATVTRNALDALSKLMVRPEPPSDGTLEGLVRELLRPMLREWLDANLPALVETLISREIMKITGTVR